MLCVRAAARGRFYCAAIVSVPLVLAATSWADAASYYYWNEQQPVTIAPTIRPIVPRKPKARHGQKPATIEKEAAKPQGPVTIAVSISKQQLKVYDANGLFAEAPVSTGMKGHSTPMGVFSVIQKQKFHRSNIYSGAPMPFMQRITWSGVALHAGVLPGYPASHGCIRMPASFAPKVYGWTRMGSRVLVTPGEVAPASFSHPLLAALKAPQPSASMQPDASAPTTTKSDKGAALASTITVATIDLRATIGHGEGARAADDAIPAARQLRTADASNALPAMASEAAPTAAPVESVQTEPRDVATDLKPGVAEASVAGGAPTADAKPAADVTPALASQPAETAQAPAEKTTAGPAKLEATGSTDLMPADAKATETKAAETKTPDIKPADDKAADVKPADAKIADQPAATTEAPAKPVDDKELSKDQSRVAAPDKPIAPKPELKRNSQVAIFISRKDSKLYVRQNFAPVFNTSISIAPSDKPLGTHVFTASADKADPATMHWSVVSLPTSVRSVAAHEGADKAARRGKKSADATIEAKPVVLQSSPAEALDRITIPADVMAWLGESLSTGSSLIVSDQGINQGETGEGTEFIVSLR
ncbi:putative ErfK/YbiS/YcfS/YnhG family protein; signal peptide [Bradyrhizobium sp. ORS 375]|uniref:L,D-transpeptidase family protein n=1 Tax=Bradyrhizobium sp. (strain ORS 375) TaxID=566679 RepID=UPI0002409BE7|nr:L,D-transpeptidase family protein [Bradyrhizobium sp. ORS 375]CCD92814.1 putative ErfK/YbiS/YcfS/YnhG family protein; signal peptide [Bradyrhizobium sp. ORS 375]